MKSSRNLLFVFAALLVSVTASAANHEVKMLNMGKEGMMAFEPAFLKANKGDTVKFVPTDMSHDVSSSLVPKGAKSWKGGADKAVTVTLSQDGVYVYECTSHVTMGMVGVIQVGKPNNLEEAKTAAKAIATKFVTNKDRFDKYLAQVK